MQLIRRRWIIGSVALLGTAALFVCVIQVEKYTFHRRAVRLIDAVASLEVGSSTFEQAQNAFGQFGAKEVDTNCSSTSCRYSVDIYPQSLAVVGRQFSRVGQDYFRRRIYRIYAMAGGSIASVRASVNIVNEKVSSTYVMITIVVPRDKCEPFELERWVVGTSYVGPRRDHSAERPDQDMRQELLHPEFLISKGIAHPNLDTGGGYTAPYIGVSISPSADIADIRRLSTFNLDCLIRWHPCTEADLMPSVNEQVETDKPRIESAVSSVKCDTDFIDRLGRLAENAAEVEYISHRTGEFRGENFQVLTARLKTKIKGVRKWSPGEIDEMQVFKGPTAVSSYSLRPSQVLIIYFKDSQYDSVHPRLWLYPCGVLPATKKNMAMIQRNRKSSTQVDSE